jgi:5-methylcytosine-specific restriction enzyme subunit McrC
MPDRAIQLVEHAWTQGVELTPDEAAALAQAPAGVEVRPTRVAGRFDVRASSIVGTVVLPTRPVVIRPKVSIDRLMWMLDVVGRVPVFGADAHFDDDADLLSTMQEQYARLLGRALALGPVREYQSTTDDVQALRGTPDFLHLTTRRFGLFPPVRCRFDEYSVDTDVNRVLLAAALSLARWRRTDAARRLETLAAALEGVRVVHFAPDRIPDPRLDRRYAHVLPALRLAQLVLRHASFEFRSGRNWGISFLVDMDKVFEEFVIVGIRRVLGLTPDELAAHPAGLHLDVGRRFRFIPDGLWRSKDGHPRVVIDAKYKQRDSADSEDVYQVVAYASALGIEKAVLVYAGVPAQEHEFLNGPRLLVLRLALDGSADDLARNVAEVARSIATFADIPTPRYRPDALRPSTAAQLVREALA